MISCKIVLALFTGASLFASQTINLSGTIIDYAGAGITGATVKLENANLSTTTDKEGKFTLSGGTPIQAGDIALQKRTPQINLQNGKLEVSLSGNTQVSVSVYDIIGRMVFKSNSMLNAGTHIIDVPIQSSGMRLYRVTIGRNAYSFKSASCEPFSKELKLTTDKNATGTFEGQAKTQAEFVDIISITKDGQLNYRDSIKIIDTSGIVIQMIPNAGDLTDADGNVYQSVRIGTQVWMVENLRTTKYNDGTVIPHVTDSTAWANLTTPAYCYYKNSTSISYQKRWGALYNWYAMNTGKLAPSGWQVPSDSDWKVLQEYLIANGFNYDGLPAGNMIAKALAAKTDWLLSNITGAIGNGSSSNNRTGFSAFPGGYRVGIGDSSFYGQCFNGYWWSATEIDVSSANILSLSSSESDLKKEISGYKGWGISVRLVRNSAVYTIIYDGNGNTGGSAPQPQTKTQGVSLTFFGNTGALVKTGYKFVGWNAAPDGSGTDYDTGANYIADVNMKLYAKWNRSINKDTIPPVISFTDNLDTIRVPVNDPSNLLSIYKNSVKAIDLNDGDITSKIIETRNVQLFKDGTGTITYSVSDSAGNSAQKIRYVVVYGPATIDTTPPVIVLLKDTLRLLTTDVFQDPGAIAIDGIDGDISRNILKTGTVDISTPGIYHVSYTVSDKAGNKATAVLTVIVTNDSGQDLEPPVIILKGKNPDSILVGNTYHDPGYTAIDNNDGDITQKVSFTSFLDSSKTGIYIITYNVTDKAGLVTSKTRTVVVWTGSN